jgi:hypothetical protein
MSRRDVRTPETEMASPTSERIRSAGEEGACEHCGALVYGDSLKCKQCGHFPIKIHCCPRCRSFSADTADRCWKCGRVFIPDSDYL